MTTYYDNTRLSCYKECPRKYYLRHVRHWRKKGHAPALAFGLSWHDAMDVVWEIMAKKPDTPILDVLTPAMTAFEARWVEEGFPSWNQMTLEKEKDLKARTPGNAAEILGAYIHERRNFFREIELIAFERPFVVPIFADDISTLYVGRRDKDFKFRGRTYVGEHKTTSDYSVAYGITPRYIESWSPNSQVDGYLHSGHMEYGDGMAAVWVDAALVHKKVRKFKFIPIERMFDQLDGWLADTQNWIRRIEFERDLLSAKRNTAHPLGGHQSHLDCFPKNTEQCNGKYGPCGFRDICRAIANPEKVEKCPEGYIEEKWEPFSVLKLAEIGMQEEG